MDSAYNFIEELGIGGIFLGTVIEALGVPFPGGIMLVLAGILVNEGKINFAFALILAVAGLNIGATAAYFIGRNIGEPFLYRFQRLFSIDQNKLDRARTWIDQSSAAFILVGRFVPMAGNMTPYLAGISRLGTVRFIIYNTIFALTWSLFNMGIGYYFSHTWRSFARFTETKLPYLAIGALLAYLAVAAAIRKKTVKRT